MFLPLYEASLYSQKLTDNFYIGMYERRFLVILTLVKNDFIMPFVILSMLFVVLYIFFYLTSSIHIFCILNNWILPDLAFITENNFRSRVDKDAIIKINML